MQQGKVGTTGPGDQSLTPPPPPLINLPGLNDDDASPGFGSGRRRWGRTILIIVVILAVILGGFLFLRSRRGAKVTYQYGQATQGNLTITVNATGPVQSGIYNLIFTGSGGKIDEIDVAVGQKVTKGQVLARLDKTLLQDAVNQAQIAVNNARASLNAAIAGANSSGGQSVSSISAAQTAVSDAKTSQAQIKAQGQASVAAAQTALNNAQANLTQVTTTANAQKQQAKAVYDATGCTASGFTPTATSTPTAATCTTAETTYKASLAQADESIVSAQSQVNAAQASLTQAQTNANANNVTAQNQVNTAQGQLNTAQSSAGVTGTTGQSQITTAQNQLNTALAQLTQAQHNLNAATLKAPHDGTVTIINGTVGGAPGATATTTGTTAGSAFIQIVDLSALQIQVNVNEADIANLQVGETATFTVNAYGNQQFTGTVDAIPPTGQTISNVVTYPVQIDIDPTSLKGAHLLPGMTANVTINAVQHNNVLLLPVNAINFARLTSSGTTSTSASGSTPQLITVQNANAALNQARQMLNNLEVANPNLVAEGPIPAFVIEQSGQQYVAKPVVLGLTDGTSYEVLQGLSLSDTFIVGSNG